MENSFLVSLLPKCVQGRWNSTYNTFKYWLSILPWDELDRKERSSIPGFLWLC